MDAASKQLSDGLLQHLVPLLFCKKRGMENKNADDADDDGLMNSSLTYQITFMKMMISTMFV